MATETPDELAQRIQHTKAYVEMRRATVLQDLHLYFLPLIKRFFDALEQTKDGQWWAPYVGYRSFKEQQKIFEDSQKNHTGTTNAQAGESAHNWGCAVDCAWMQYDCRGQDMWNKADWTVFSQVVSTIPGLAWGGNFTTQVNGVAQPMGDKPHVQLALNCRWKDIGNAYRIFGEARARTMILEKAITNEEGNLKC